jgi:hypothetical protein
MRLKERFFKFKGHSIPHWAMSDVVFIVCFSNAKHRGFGIEILKWGVRLMVWNTHYGFDWSRDE